MLEWLKDTGAMTPVRAARMYRGYTQKELAEKAGLSQSTVCNVEEGKPGTARTILKIAKALEVPVECLTEEG